MLENKKRILPLLQLGDLQFFGGRGDASDGNDSGQNPSGDGGHNGHGENDADRQSGNNESYEGNQEHEQPKGFKTEQQRKGTRENLFTQQDVNNIVARESRAAQEKLLKQLGVTDVDSAKEGLKQLKEFQDSQKTELEVLQEDVEAKESTIQKQNEEINHLNAKISAMAAGVNPDTLEDVIVLANNLVNDETDINAAITKVIEKYPHFKLTQTEEDGNEEGQEQQAKDKSPQFMQQEHNGSVSGATKDKWKDAFNFN